MSYLFQLTTIDQQTKALIEAMGIKHVKGILVDGEQHIMQIQCEEGITYFLGIMRVEIK